MTGRVVLRVNVVAVSFAVLAAAGCGASHSHVAGGPQQPAVRRCVAGSIRPIGSARVAWAAEVLRPTAAYRSPGGEVIQRFGLRNVNGAATVFGVLGREVDARCRPAWLHVALPIRPNGATGWVRADDVKQSPVHARITVDLSERRVRLYRNGKLVLSAVAAIGSSATPTPLGRYYVNQRLIPADPSGPYGPGAVGISAFSTVLTGWAQGGPIAIHGTNEPASIGHAVSNGCIRLPNPVLRRVFAQAPAGTPVLIRR
jgi:lipoprotein-anchoring transpeptidase ErfK/SrfK